MPSCFDRFADLAVERFDHVRCVNDATDLWWERHEWDHLFPVVFPGLSDDWVALSPLRVECFKRLGSVVGVSCAIDRSECLGDLSSFLARDEPQTVTN